MDEAYKYAKEALSLHIYGMELDDDEIPKPSVTLDPADVAGCIVCPITIFPDVVKNELDHKRVKTNVTIPYWLKEIAEKQHINYSRLLETALMDYLQITKR